MAEIIRFNDKRGGLAGSSSSAAAYAVQTHVNQDWDNQELADLYRVKRLLDQAGVIIETDRGITDEGDPWFVFCHPNGDVFVHLTRFDGEYLLDSTSIDAPLRGNSFTDLINSFVDRAVEKRAANVVSLRPGEGVYLHPAIMLTALIWTMFVASDELVGMAHGAEIDQAGVDFDILLDVPLTETDGAFGILHAALAERDAQEVASDAASAPKPVAEPGERETQTVASTAILPNPISLSLSAIAVTFGMSSKSSFEFLQNSKAPTEQAALFGASEFGLDATDPQNPDELNADIKAAFDEMAATNSANDVPTANEQAQQGAPSQVAVFNVPNAFLFTHDGVNGNAAGLDIMFDGSFDVAFSTSSIAIISHAADEKKPAQASKAAPTSAKPAAEPTADANEVSANIRLELDFGHNVALSTYNIDNQELLASFDISKAAGIDWDSLFARDILTDAPTKEETVHKPTGGTIRATEVTEYSQKAMDFVKFLLAERDTVELVVLEGKIILVDLSAFDEVTDISYLRSWSYDDVGIVSTIGHLADFEAFGLVIA